jgi:RNA polymerase sigma-70 factor (ECF subfamily)
VAPWLFQNWVIAESIHRTDREEEAGFDLSACLNRVRLNDQAAARSLVERLYPLVIHVVRGNLPRLESEEDMAQEVFMKMFAKLDQYEGVVPFEHWVARIAVNACLNRIRAQTSRPELRWADLNESQIGALENTSAGDAHPVDSLVARDLVDLLLEPLSPDDQIIVRMMELEDRSIEEIRQLTGWSATYIRVRAFRARRKLNKKFSKLWKEGKL